MKRILPKGWGGDGRTEAEIRKLLEGSLKEKEAETDNLGKQVSRP